VVHLGNGPLSDWCPYLAHNQLEPEAVLIE